MFAFDRIWYLVSWARVQVALSGPFLFLTFLRHQGINSLVKTSSPLLSYAVHNRSLDIHPPPQLFGHLDRAGRR